MPRRLVVVLALLAAALAAGPAAPAHGQQTRTGGQRIQAGLGILPGVGIQAAYVQPRNIYTREAALFVDVSPSFAGGEGSVQLSGAFGGAVRIMGILAIFQDARPLYDIDVGARLGPGLFFAINDASREAKNQRFTLFLEPYVRLSTSLGTGRIFFAELGSQRPLVRAGLWLSL